MAWSTSVLITFAAVNLFVLLEWLLTLLVRRNVYSLSGTLTNVAAYTIYLIIAAIYGYLTYLIMGYLQLALHITPLKVTWWYWLALVIGEDFSFYWFHRFSHKFGILWMSHVVHHSAHEFNYSVGLRQTWLPFLGLIFWLPLALVGFSPEHILIVQGFSLSYQFLMHTRLTENWRQKLIQPLRLLGSLWGYIFNTPSHHRVHHGMNAEYIDRNFAGLLIIWDRLFGTFTPEVAPVQYGVPDPPGRGEVIFVQLNGPAQFLKGLVVRHGTAALENPYARQKTSALLAFFLLLSALAIFFAAIKNPRWFL